MRLHLLESAQRSVHRFHDESTDAEVRRLCTYICMQIAALRRRLTKQPDSGHAA